VKTSLFLIEHKGRFLIRKEPPGREIYAVWKDLSMRLWEEMTQGKSDIGALYLTAWSVALEETNLFGDVTKSWGPTEQERLKEFIPGKVPRTLVKKYVTSAALTPQELKTIEYQCERLFRYDMGIDNPHPLLDKVLTAMLLKEKYGIPMYRDHGELPQKVLNAMKVITNLQSELNTAKTRQKALEAKAIKERKGHH